MHSARLVPVSAAVVGVFAALLTFASIAQASTVVVVPADMATSTAQLVGSPQKWFFYNDETDSIDNTLGSFVTGPGTPLAGTGSAQISVTGTQRRNLATYQFSGVPLSAITTLKFATYNPSAGNGGSATRSAYLQFNADFNGTDTWQRRLVYLPSDNGSIVQNTWKEWDAVAGGNAKWRYSGATWPVDGLPGTTLKTWSQIIAQYPGIRIRVTDSWLGIRVGEPYADGYTENIDKFSFATANNSVVYDFELVAPPPPPPTNPTTLDQCKNNGWAAFGFKNQGLCNQFVNTGKDSRNSSAPGLRSQSAAAVQALLHTADRGGPTGQEVRDIAWDQAFSAERMGHAMTEVESRGGFMTILFGSDYKNIGQIRSELVVAQNTIDRLQKAMDKATDPIVKAELAAQITEMQTTASSTQAFVDEHEGKFSLLGWLVRLLDK